jgi:hypothetical protein
MFTSCSKVEAFVKEYRGYLANRISTLILVIIFFVKMMIDLVGTVSKIDNDKFVIISAVIVCVAITWIKSRKCWLFIIIMANLPLIMFIVNMYMDLYTSVMNQSFSLTLYISNVMGLISGQSRATLRLWFMDERNCYQLFCLVSTWSLFSAKYVSGPVISYLKLHWRVVTNEEAVWNIVISDIMTLLGSVTLCFIGAVVAIGILDSIIKSVVIVLGMFVITISIRSEVSFLYNFDFSMTAICASYQSLVVYNDIPEVFRFLCKNKINALDSLGIGFIVLAPVQTAVGCIGSTLEYFNTLTKWKALHTTGYLLSEVETFWDELDQRKARKNQ